MSVTDLRRLERLFLSDERITADEARMLLAATEDRAGLSGAERDELKAMLKRNAGRLSDGGRDVLEQYLGAGREAPTAASVLRSERGLNAASLDDDRVVLGADGTLRGDSGVTPYTRSYAAVAVGPLRHRHGSLAPKSVVLDAREQARVRAQPPGAALDAAAKVHGVDLVQSFEQMANSKEFSDPKAPFWWGKCHAWAWSALSNELSARVDVGGPEGGRGLWVAGQWLSRADLGNWMMGVADQIAVAEPAQLFDDQVTPEDLLKATAQYLLDGGGGVIADIHNDRAHGGAREVWNQPFVAAQVDARTLSGEGAEYVLALARRDGHGGAKVKHVHVVGRYANEKSDAHEGPWNSASRSWNLYAVTDAQGKVLTAYSADDPRLNSARSLPTRQSHELPEYFWKPTLKAIDDTLAGRPNRTVDRSQHGEAFRFFIDTVLRRGVPGATRAAFEAEVQRLPAGEVSAEARRTLQERFPGVAEAYAPAEWSRSFGARGLDAAAFGATWARVRTS